MSEVDCYICLEKINDPIYPSGCNHGFCKKHLEQLIVIHFNIILLLLFNLQTFKKIHCPICNLPFQKDYIENISNSNKNNELKIIKLNPNKNNIIIHNEIRNTDSNRVIKDNINSNENRIQTVTIRNDIIRINNNNNENCGEKLVKCILCCTYPIITFGFNILIIGITIKNPFTIILSIFNILTYIPLGIIFVMSLSMDGYNNDYCDLFCSIDISIGFILLSLAFINTVYISTAHYCCNYNTNIKIEEKRLTLLNNILVGGTGTIIYGFSRLCESNMTCINKLKYILFGLIQFFPIIFYISVGYNNEKIKKIPIFLYIPCYIFSFVSGILICNNKI